MKDTIKTQLVLIGLLVCFAQAADIAAGDTQPSNKKVYVVLFGGQSNALGWGYEQYLLDENHSLATPQDDVQMYTGCGMPSVLNQLLPLQSGAGKDVLTDPVRQYPALTNAPISRFGPELSLARTVRDDIETPDSEVVIIKYAKGGSTLYHDWKADGTSDSSADGSRYQTFQSTVHAGLAEIQAAYPYHEVEVLGMGWVQGESDALNAVTYGNPSFANNYETNLTTFIADVRATFGSNMVFVLSRLSTNQSDNVYWPTIRAAQAAVAAADPRVVATEADGAVYPTAIGFAEGRIHFLSSSYLQIGEDLGHALVTTTALDADDDHLPDEWENRFTPPGAAGLGNAPEDDYDGDGISDRGEFRLGTSPVDPEDGLSLSFPSVKTVQWPARRGINYTVQHSTNLLHWVPVETLVAESNRTLEVDCSAAATNRHGFFRVRVEE